MNIAVFDCVQRDRATLSEYIKRFCSEQLCDCHIDEYGSCEELLEVITPDAYHMVFLDMYESAERGIECAKRIRQVDANVILVFLTELEPHFREGYELGVRSYLVKPIEESSVRSSIRRSTKSNNCQSLEVLSENAAVKVPVQSIQYIENSSELSVIHTDDFLIKTRAGLDELLSKLDSRKFIRCHPNFLINTSSVIKLNENSFMLRGGQEIPICLPDKNGMLEKYFSFDISLLLKA